jgi:uncharacterized protein (DUF1778 family)
LIRSQDIHIRVTVEEKRAIAYAATLVGKDMSSWIRALIAAAIEREKEHDALTRRMYPGRYPNKDRRPY